MLELNCEVKNEKYSKGFLGLYLNGWSIEKKRSKEEGSGEVSCEGLEQKILSSCAILI